MNGYQITFITAQNRLHKGQPVAEWLIRLAKELGLRGATLIPASEGFGRNGLMHSAHFFELADQPLEVVLAVTGEESERLFAQLHIAQVKLFYVKTPVEFGVIGDDAQ